MNDLQKAPTSSVPSSPARTEHRTWIKGRAATLLSHYWREDDDPALLAAIGKDWADVLEGIPQEYIQRACIQYQRDEPRRKPTPGAIYQIARALMPRPEIVLPPQPLPPPKTEKSADEIAAEEAWRAQRKAEASRIMNEFGYRHTVRGADDA